MRREEALPDVQALPDTRGVVVDQAGVRGVRHPIVVLDRRYAKQETVATLSMSTQVVASAKGAHMSRFIEALNDWVDELTVRTAPGLLSDIAQRLASPSVWLEVEFPYFIERRAPVTGARGLLDVDCRFECRLTEQTFDFVMTVTVPVTTVCPCSRAISDYGAHNQRGRVTITVRPTVVEGEHEFVWIEDLVDVAERAASAPVYPVLKRPDERFVTMQAYDHPAFVEDVVRSVATQLDAEPRILNYRVEAVNDESIHNHAAFARLGQV